MSQRPDRPRPNRGRSADTPVGYRQDQRLRESLQKQGSDVDAAKISGRALPGGAQPAAPLAPRAPVAVGGMLTAGPGGTPFANAQVDVGTNIAPSSANSFQVMTIVMGILAMITMLAVASLAVIVVGYLGWVGKRLDGDGLANKGGHLRDTGLVDEIDPNALLRKRRGGGGGGAAIPEPGDPMAEMFGGIGGAPVTVFAKGKMADQYHGIEVFCDRVPGFRKRKPLRKQKDGRFKAHIPIIPATKCRLVFQGNVPVKTYVTGGDVAECTFNPIVCRAR